MQTPALDPRPNPAGTALAYVHDGALRVHDLVTGRDTAVAAEAGVTFGLAEFVAAEEMGRSRGYWWSPDGRQLLAARVDESPVARWHIADPANPDQAPAEVVLSRRGHRQRGRFPGRRDPARARGPAGPSSSARPRRAELAGVAGWDRAAFPYLVSAAWGDDLLIVVQTRDQKTMRVLDGHTGQVLREDTDPDWTDVVDGVPPSCPAATSCGPRSAVTPAAW